MPIEVAPSIRLLAVSGSLRGRSSNTELLRAVAALARPAIRVEFYRGLADLPHFNPDLDQVGAELPALVCELRGQVDQADGLLISSPEYAHGVPGSLKNGLDWLVSGPEMVFKPIGLLNAAAHSTHAHESLAETLRTMSAVLVPGASVRVPVSGRALSSQAIEDDPDHRAVLHAAIRAMEAAVSTYREQRASLPEVFAAKLGAGR